MSVHALPFAAAMWLAIGASAGALFTLVWAEYRYADAEEADPRTETIDAVGSRSAKLALLLWALATIAGPGVAASAGPAIAAATAALTLAAGTASVSVRHR